MTHESLIHSSPPNIYLFQRSDPSATAGHSGADAEEFGGKEQGPASGDIIGTVVGKHHHNHRLCACFTCLQIEMGASLIKEKS